jgi:hypothetical protein
VSSVPLSHLYSLSSGFPSSPDFSSFTVPGSDVTVLAIDNSNYQISEGALGFFVAKLEEGLPIILLLHIPMHLGEYTK